MQDDNQDNIPNLIFQINVLKLMFAISVASINQHFIFIMLKSIRLQLSTLHDQQALVSIFAPTEVLIM